MSESTVAVEIEHYRSTREQVERGVLPRATSIDGSGFELQASLHGLRLRRGGYVVLETPTGQRLGQVTDLVAATQVVDRPAGNGGSGSGASLQVALARGEGVVLDGDGQPFHDAPVRPATSEEVAAGIPATPAARAGLTVGELLLAPGVPAVLDSGGLARHTFMCGQSGSGKTYSLGVLLERVLADTTLRVVVLDPNSDYVGLGDLRETDSSLARRYAAGVDGIQVWRDTADATHPLRLRFGDLSPAARAAVLGLDPLSDRDEYAVLVDLLRAQGEGGPLVTGVEDLLTDERVGAHDLGVRARNLGVFDWTIWSRGVAPSLVDELRHPTARCLVVDTGSLGTVAEQRVVSQAVLDTLWQERDSHTPTLVVVDEAHNVCAAEPEDTLSRLTTGTAVHIAAEGRKFGLYLLVSTQQPHKVHANVLSQCDNLLLMRMNSTADLADLERTFSFVAPGLVAGAVRFGQGHSLVAGRLASHPAYVRMGERVTREGGADIPLTWAAPR